MNRNPAWAAPATSASPQKYSLWHYVWKLLRLRIKVFWSGLVRARVRRKVGTAILTLVILAAVGFVFFLSWLLLGFLRSPSLAEVLAAQSPVSIELFLESIPVLILAVVFLGLLFTSFGMLLQALYLADDLDFLLSAPIPARAVFVAKLLEAILPNFALVALLGLPILFGLGVSGGYTIPYYPLAVLVMGMLVLASSGLSGLLVMGVVRIVPARRVAEVLGFLGAVFSILCSQSGQIINFLNADVEEITARQLPLSMLTRFNVPWSPLAWAGRGLVDIGEGRWLSGMAFTGLTLVLAGILFLVSLNTAEHLYYSGWAGMQINARKKKPARPAAAPRVRRSPVAAWIARFVASPIRAILAKDFLLLRRDLRNMSQLVTPLIFGVIYGFFLLRSGGIPTRASEEIPVWAIALLKDVMIYMNVGISLFVSWSLISRLALMGFSMEGKNYWMLKTAPVRTGHLIAAKYFVAYLPALIVGWVYFLVISLMQSSSFPIMVFGFFVVAFAIAGSAGINLAMGIAGANLKWEDPRRMNSGLTGCVSMLISFGYMIVCLSLFFAPPVIFALFGLPTVAGQAVGLIFGGAVCLACAVLPLWLVRGRVRQIGEA